MIYFVHETSSCLLSFHFVRISFQRQFVSRMSESVNAAGISITAESFAYKFRVNRPLLKLSAYEAFEGRRKKRPFRSQRRRKRFLIGSDSKKTAPYDRSSFCKWESSAWTKGSIAVCFPTVCEFDKYDFCLMCFAINHSTPRRIDRTSTRLCFKFVNTFVANKILYFTWK